MASKQTTTLESWAGKDASEEVTVSGGMKLKSQPSQSSREEAQSRREPVGSRTEGRPGVWRVRSHSIPPWLFILMAPSPPPFAVFLCKWIEK